MGQRSGIGVLKEGAQMKTKPGLTEFEELLQRLQWLTRAEIAELVTSWIPVQDAQSFAALADGLSIEALRFVSARALLRQQSTTAHRR
jgi:hypothetical protein